MSFCFSRFRPASDPGRPHSGVFTSAFPLSLISDKISDRQKYSKGKKDRKKERTKIKSQGTIYETPVQKKGNMNSQTHSLKHLFERDPNSSSSPLLSSPPLIVRPPTWPNQIGGLSSWAYWLGDMILSAVEEWEGEKVHFGWMQSLTLPIIPLALLHHHGDPWNASAWGTVPEGKFFR